jgi:hypothetical protein
MGIQINGNTDTIAAIDGALTVSGAELAGTSNINVAGIITATGFVGNVTGNINSTGVSTIATLNVAQSNPTRLNVSGVSTFSGGIVVSAGSTSAPSISPSGDSNTGIFFPSADTIAFAEGGVESGRFDSSGRLGIGTISAVKTLDVRGEATFGSGVTISDLNWSKDTNQLVYTFSGTAGGGNPSDGLIALVSPNANPSATRIGSLVYGNKVSGTTATTNPGLKAGIDCVTNTNVANAADTGAYMNFYTKPDNGSFRSQMILNSNGVLTKPYQPAFLAYRNTTLAVSATWQNISSGILIESYDVGSVYSTATFGRFVAPVAGKYMFYAGGWSVANSNGERYAFGVKVNNGGSPDFLTGGNYCITDSPLVPFQIVLNLAANDYVELFFFSAVSTSIGGSTHWLYWGGYLLG